MMVEKAVILAAGEGSRMREAREAIPLRPDQERVADSGLKGLMPFGRPFLDYVLEALRQSGVLEVCLVVGPRHAALRAFVAERAGGDRLLTTAVQDKPLGSGSALACAREFAGSAPFLVLNSDTFYTVESLRDLAAQPAWGVLAVERRATLLDSATNLTPERLASFAVAELRDENVVGLDEKPGQNRYDRLPDPVWSSVNCWRFDPSIFDHCDSIQASPRGEFELPDVAMAGVRAGSELRLIPATGVLDLSTREDVAAVGRLLPAWFESVSDH